MTTKAAIIGQDAMANKSTDENRELTIKELETVHGGNVQFKPFSITKVYDKASSSFFSA